MDTLTLLCDRFGDGRALLAHLHDAGCRECGDLERFDLDELTQLLGATRDIALQLQCEARALSESVQPSPRATPLRPEAVLGLELEHCMQLRRLGVDSVEDLAAAGALELARALDIGVDRVMRWQTCARRALEAPPCIGLEHQAAAPAHAGYAHIAPAYSGRFSPNETGFIPRPGGLERDLASYDAHAVAGQRAERK
jgi:hypothetical protein